MLANYRRDLSLSGAKDDPLDAELVCDFGAKHQDRFRPFLPQDPCTRQLQLLVGGGRDFEQRKGLSNQLGAVLK